MRVRTLEIRWHDSKPISACDFQPVPFKKARPTQDKNFVGQSYKLATGGEDNHVRVRPVCLIGYVTRAECTSPEQLWMVHPNIMPQSVLETAGADATAPRAPRVEYLATLSRHSAAVNVVRWNPNGTRQDAFLRGDADRFSGELIASAGDGACSSLDCVARIVLMDWVRWNDHYLGSQREPACGELWKRSEP